MRVPALKFPKKSLNLVVASLLFSVLYWCLEAFRDVSIFHRGTVLKRIFYPDALSFWMRLLVILILLLFGIYSQTLRQRIHIDCKPPKETERNMRILFVGGVFSAAYWILESVRDVFVYQKGSFFHQLIRPDPMDFWMRFLPVCILLLFSMYTQNLLNEHKHVQHTLRGAKEKLEELDRLKSDFLSTVSHELRTPIAIMREGVSLCMDSRIGPLNKTQQKLLGDTIQNIDRLNRLVTDLLDLSKIESGKLKLRRSIFDLRDTVAGVINLYRPQAGQKRIQIESTLPEHPVNLFADADKVMQIFDNLISNSFRFTLEGGEVWITIKDLPDAVQCEVSDTGIGIKQENLKKMFSKFEQFGRQAGPGYKGTGLGLSICKGLVEKHGGQIWVKSQPGKETTFFFTLKKESLPKILVVDDEKETVALIKTGLEQDQYGVLEAYDGESAVRTAQSEKPALVILDMNLGPTSGYEVIGRLKHDTRTSQIPILILSGFDLDASRLTDEDTSEIPFLKKPVRLEILRNSVRDIFTN